jgi:hypothetical protein
MRALFSVFAGILAACLIVFSPSCTKAQGAVAWNLVTTEVDCVGGELLKGDLVIEDIALACVPLAIADVESIVAAKALEADEGGAPTEMVRAARLAHHREPKR